MHLPRTRVNKEGEGQSTLPSPNVQTQTSIVHYDLPQQTNRWLTVLWSCPRDELEFPFCRTHCDCGDDGRIAA